MVVNFAMAQGPLSVVLPPALRARLSAEAKRRGLPLSTAVRVLAAERVGEIDEASEVSQAQRWQRAQAWSAWEEVVAGTADEASAAELSVAFDQALSHARRAKR